MAAQELNAALRGAAERGDVKAVRHFLAAGADPSEPTSGSHLYTPLILAALGGHSDVIPLLVAAGADVNGTNAKGETALMVAAEYGRATVVTALIAAGADIEAVEEDGWTALFFAARFGQLQAIAALIAAGASVTVLDVFGRRPENLAEDNGHHACFDLLHKTRIELLNEPIRTGIDWAALA